MRIFQGVTGQAGQPDALARGLRQRGNDARSFTIADHRFGYRADERLDIQDSRDMPHVREITLDLIERFDVFHFHARPIVPFSPNLIYPAMHDVLLIRSYGKKVFLHLRGGEIRDRQLFARKSPFAYSYIQECSHLFDSITDDHKRLLKSVLLEICNGVFVVDPELQTYVPEADIVPRALDPSSWQYVGSGLSDTPLVVHAPSRRTVKGTDFVLSAIENLRRKGINFRFQLVDGLSNDQAKDIYSRADIVIDQLRIGWYGVLAVEAMALGKVVICYIRDDLWDKHGQELSILNANPNNIEEVLEEAISNREMRAKLGKKSRAYFEKTHSVDVVCDILEELYSRPNKPVETRAFSYLNDYQFRLVKNDVVGKTAAATTAQRELARFERGKAIPSELRGQLRLAGRLPIYMLRHIAKQALARVVRPNKRMR